MKESRVGNTSTSGPVDGTSSGPVDGTSTAPRGPVDGTESYLLNVPTGTLKVSRNEDAPAVPTAPPVAAPAGSTAASAVDPKEVAAPLSGFEELWAVYPRKHHRSKAQAAYKALAPSPALHSELVTKASVWAAHYQQTATEMRWRKHLHTWLVEERYLEDLPEPYENPKEAAIARKRENGPRKAGKSNDIGESGLSPKTPIGKHAVKIVNVELTGGSFDEEREFVVSFNIQGGDHEGKDFSHVFKLVSADETEQMTGQAIYTQLRNATGVIEPDDTSDFHDKSLLAVVGKMGRVEYASL
jgi:hypothetical protein